ncbi:MAG: Na+/H+ antiporter subunit E [Cyanobacteria bacterium SBLK]|nr:Na+/H+ antiporter subunit E [Cyanobacteria bacterium SBLK]
MVGHLILRLTIWFLLTANLSWPNIAIGVAIALIIPRNSTNPERLKEWLSVSGKLLWALPIAYIEAFELIFRPHNEEEIVLEQVAKARSHRLVFLDILLITFTPKTIVVRYREEGWYEVHRVVRRKKK